MSRFWIKQLSDKSFCITDGDKDWFHNKLYCQLIRPINSIHKFWEAIDSLKEIFNDQKDVREDSEDT